MSKWTVARVVHKEGRWEQNNVGEQSRVGRFVITKVLLPSLRFNYGISALSSFLHWPPHKFNINSFRRSYSVVVHLYLRCFVVVSWFFKVLWF